MLGFNAVSTHKEGPLWVHRLTPVQSVFCATALMLAVAPVNSALLNTLIHTEQPGRVLVEQTAEAQLNQILELEPVSARRAPKADWISLSAVDRIRFKLASRHAGSVRDTTDDTVGDRRQLPLPEALTQEMPTRDILAAEPPGTASFTDLFISTIDNPEYQFESTQEWAVGRTNTQTSNATFESLQLQKRMTLGTTGPTNPSARTASSPTVMLAHKNILATDQTAVTMNSQSGTMVPGLISSDKEFAISRGGEQDKPASATEPEFVIVLDPGHGGSDPGAAGHNGLLEKNLTLQIARRTALFLSEIDGLSIVLTREKDEGLSRYRRVQRVIQSDADLVVSIHLNHLPQTDINLVETFYAAPGNIAESRQKQHEELLAKGLVKTVAPLPVDTTFTDSSKRLAGMMQRRVYDEVEHGNKGTDNAGVKQDTLYVLTRSFIPGALIELTCLSNQKEADRLADPAYLDNLAAAMADGIREYLASSDEFRLAKLQL